jgi:hypothetical protein
MRRDVDGPFATAPEAGFFVLPSRGRRPPLGCPDVVLDSINARYGRDTLTVAAAGTRKAWVARAENKTPCYTTRWAELPKAWAH